MIPHEDLAKLIALLSNAGVSRFKSPELELELRAAPKNGEQTETAQALSGGLPPWESLSSEQQLLWSATPIENNKV